MNKYAWNEIIFNPTSEEAKNCIGKMVYYADNPSICLKSANGECDDRAPRILESIQPDDIYPFYVGTGGNYHYSCIILKKEEPKEYVPFKDIDEFIIEYEKHTQKLKPYGFWIKQKVLNQLYRIESITGIFLDGIFINRDKYLTSWDDFLKYYVFEDGTPCGKLKE